ncbi:transcription factor Maf-like [Drosophila santomea]|uniref:transcription factor Maf-like n=1 Tax=Drosophila santomea TaxID=129105 RepID=UPI001CD009F2|nr:transcription factor Maf-like [Drosophila santomea]
MGSLLSNSFALLAALLLCCTIGIGYHLLRARSHAEPGASTGAEPAGPRDGDLLKEGRVNTSSFHGMKLPSCGPYPVACTRIEKTADPALAQLPGGRNFPSPYNGSSNGCNSGSSDNGSNDSGGSDGSGSDGSGSGGGRGSGGSSSDSGRSSTNRKKPSANANFEIKFTKEHVTQQQDLKLRRRKLSGRMQSSKPQHRALQDDGRRHLLQGTSKWHLRPADSFRGCCTLLHTPGSPGSSDDC